MAAALYGVVVLLAAAGAWALVRWQNRLPIVDVPNERSSHRSPTPRSGGIAIAFGLLAGTALFGALAPVEFGRGGWVWPLGGGLAFSALGLLDDLFSLPEWQRLLIQKILAFGIAVWGPRLAFMPLPGAQGLALGWVGVVVTAFWYTGFINAFNFMDGTDGMAAGEALLAGLAIGLLSKSVVPLILSAAAAGFLVLNYPPAKIFMGDSGSYLLGSMLAILAVSRSTEGGGGAIPFLSFILMLGTFIADTSCTLLGRVLRGERWLKAHRSHFYQRMTDIGFSHARVFWVNCALTAALCASAFCYAAQEDRGRLLILIFWTAALLSGMRWIVRCKALIGAM